MCGCKMCATSGCINCKCHKEINNQDHPFMVRLFETLERLEEKIDAIDQDLQKIGEVLFEEIEEED